MLQSTISISSLLTAILLLGGSAVRGATIDITINTSSLSGTDGGIYFQFSPGLNADPASVSIVDFQLTKPGALNPGSPLNFSDGGAAGSLDANNLTINNSTALNDYGEALEFGTAISFAVVLNRPATLTGNSGSELDIQATGPDLLTPVLTSDGSGNIVEISYDAAGSLNAFSTSSNGMVHQAKTPEPGTWSWRFPFS